MRFFVLGVKINVDYLFLIEVVIIFLFLVYIYIVLVVVVCCILVCVFFICFEDVFEIGLLFEIVEVVLESVMFLFEFVCNMSFEIIRIDDKVRWLFEVIYFVDEVI